MELDDYQARALETAVYPREHAVEYPIVGLANESGELLGKAVKKVMRGDYTIDDVREKAIAELGDCLWYVAVAAYDLGVPLSKLAQLNINKLADRKERNVIKGDGDSR